MKLKEEVAEDLGMKATMSVSGRVGPSLTGWKTMYDTQLAGGFYAWWEFEGLSGEVLY